MRLLSSLGFGLLGLATAVLAQDEPAAAELDRASFKKFIDKNNVVMTECELPNPFLIFYVHVRKLTDRNPPQSTQYVQHILSWLGNFYP